MKLNLNEQDNLVIVSVEGRLDTTTFSDFETALAPYLDGSMNLVLDFSGLEYLSSAGLRVILRTQQKIESTDRTMVIKNCNAEVMEIFELTGFIEFITFE